MRHPGQSPLPDALRNYDLWTMLTRVGAWDMTLMRNEAENFSYKPEISILLPVYNPQRAWLESALDSVLSQTYPYWKLCVCNDASTEPHIAEVLDFYERLDERILVNHLEDNVGIAGATNEAFSLAEGEFVTLLDNDDTLAPHALFEVAGFLQEHPDADLIYTDEDKINEAGDPLQPHFKPGWSPDMALAVNYLVHLSVYRRRIIEEIGGWRLGLDGAQDLDLMLRYTERTQNIHHIPKVLYHWRIVEGSVAGSPDSKGYTHERARRAVREALERRGIDGEVRDSFMPNAFRVERKVEGSPKVSVVVPAGKGEDAVRCVAALESHAGHDDYEILLVGGSAATGSNRARSLQAVEGHSPLEQLNFAVGQAEGEFVLLLSPNLEAVSQAALKEMLSYAQRPEVGAVGGKLLGSEGQVVQAGLILHPEKREDLPQTFHRPFDRGHPGFRMFTDLSRNCSALSASCMMIRKEVFESVGGFDTEHFDDVFGDVDLCLRLRERGYLHVYTPYAEFVQHTPEPLAGLEPERASYARERWGDTLANEPYYNPNLRWDAADLPASLELMGLRKRRVAATRKQRLPEN